MHKIFIVKTRLACTFVKQKSHNCNNHYIILENENTNTTQV